MSEPTLPTGAQLISIARNEQELGSWPKSEVLRGLTEGRFLPGDYFWHAGLPQWRRLADLNKDETVPSQFRRLTFAIHFGSGRAIDKFGFVRQGELTVSADTIELRGLRHWPSAGRFGVGVVGWGMLAFAFAGLARFFGAGDAGALGHALTVMLGLMALIGAPFLSTMLVHYFCASPARLSLPKSQITSLMRDGLQISFTAPRPGSRKPLLSVFRAESDEVAAQIEKLLSNS